MLSVKWQPFYLNLNVLTKQRMSYFPQSATVHNNENLIILKKG